MTHPTNRHTIITGRTCTGCGQPLPDWKRADATYCTHLCKEAHKRRRLQDRRPR